jgi:hypothetical protein
MQPTPEIIAAILEGPLHEFAGFSPADLPSRGAGIYTIRDRDGSLVYVGVAGRNPDGAGLARRLRSHASGRRSGDQFCIYVADHYVLPELSARQVRAVASMQLSMDSLVREKVRGSCSFRVASASDYSAALAVESWVKAENAPSGPPLLNPSSPQIV